MENSAQSGAPVQQSSMLSVSSKPPLKSHILRNIIIILIILLIIAYVLYHFNILGFRVLVHNVAAKIGISSSTTYSSAFSSVTSTSQASSVVSDYFNSSPGFNLSYYGSVKLDFLAGNASSGVSAGFTLPISASIAKSDYLFRASYLANLSSLYAFIRSILPATNTSNSSKKPGLIRGMVLYNGTGVVDCYGQSVFNCTYTKSYNASSLSNSTSEDLLGALGINQSAISGLFSQYKVNSSLSGGNSPIQLRFLKNVVYSGNTCSLMEIKDTGSKTANVNLSGQVCFSNYIGLPLFLNAQLSVGSTIPTLTVDFNFSSILNLSIPPSADIISLPSGANIKSI